MLYELIKPAYAAVTNPAVGELGSSDIAAERGIIFGKYFIGLWKTLINVGVLLVFLYFIWGAIGWITAGGDTSKVEKARDRMVQAVIGMIILASSFVILGFIGNLFLGAAFNIFELTFGF